MWDKSGPWSGKRRGLSPCSSLSSPRSASLTKRRQSSSWLRQRGDKEKGFSGGERGGGGGAERERDQLCKSKREEEENLDQTPQRKKNKISCLERGMSSFRPRSVLSQFHSFPARKCGESKRKGSRERERERETYPDCFILLCTPLQNGLYGW